jgi:DNA-binding XRE family transcriptional regulator
MMTETGYTPANLRALIERSGLTQAATADLIGVNQRGYE